MQEVDIATGRVLFEWHSAPHVAVDETYEQPRSDDAEAVRLLPHQRDRARPGRDAAHLRPGTRTRSTRSAAATAPWSGGSAARRATSGSGPARDSRGSTTSAGSPTGRSRSSTTARAADGGKQSRVIVLRVDERRPTATLVRSYEHHPRAAALDQPGQRAAPARRSRVRRLGIERVLHGVRAATAACCSTRGSARAAQTRTAPTASRGSVTPRDRPAVAARARKAGGTLVYASWNGATDVSDWRVLAGAADAGCCQIGTARKQGFETSVATNSTDAFFAVQALDSRGRVRRDVQGRREAVTPRRASSSAIRRRRSRTGRACSASARLIERDGTLFLERRRRRAAAGR